MDRQKSLPEDTRKELRRWLESLPPLADQIPPIRQFHGYSGRWKVQANFSLWQNKPVKKGQVVFNGFTALCLHAGGTTGFGVQKGILTVNVGDYRPRFDIFNEVEHASIDQEGELTLTIKVLHRELLERTKSTPARSEEDWLKKPKLALTFQVHLRSDPKNSKSLHGFHELTPSARFQQHATETWDYLGL